jgi:hypothetical protein
VTYVNLIPTPRRERVRRAAHLRRWGFVAGALTAVVLVGVFVAHVARWSDHRDVLERRDRLATLVQSAEQDLAGLQGELAGAMARQRASEAVGRRADWSVLLALLAETKGEDIALRRCRLAPGQETVQRGGLQIEGYGLTQQAVSQFVIRLEQVGLFRTVKLTETRREPLGTGHAVAFRVESVFE